MDHITSHVGKAYGIVTLLRGLEWHASQRICYLPNDLTFNLGVSTESLIRSLGSSTFSQTFVEDKNSLDLKSKTEVALKEIVFQIATIAHNHLLTAKSLNQQIPPSAISVLLPGVRRHFNLKQV